MTEAVEFLKAKGYDPKRLEQKMSRGLFNPEETLKDMRFRENEFITNFGMSIPDDDAIAACHKHEPLLEIGAGCGYWAYELQKVGADIIATEPKQGLKNHYPFKDKKWTELEELTAVDAVKKYPDRNLLIVWPSYDSPWAHEALKEFKASTVIYVGEGRDGCTADDAFHDLLDSNFVLIDCVYIPQFWCIHDFLSVWKRR